ncbi:hypothetical protein FN846DRAFT_897061 [Sphaerosporella brunnea]|uniref:Integral membrane protein n=1 Tax=Sphaerosporella brunnea TaxID=1250544 RepID=A0A5J5F975_9PEZI|nr:hypothetical protein FN846DRAFT_897061 [Sphaerosporella brunnea]
MDMHVDVSHAPATNTTADAGYYFAYAPRRGWLILHILTMVAGWVVLMPLATILALNGSRHHPPVQLAFLATNAVGIVFATIYNTSTPDLYPGNAHHKMGWALLWILAAQAAIGVLAAVVRSSPEEMGWSKERARFMPIPTECRRSDDSGHGGSMDHGSSDYERPDEDEEEWDPAESPRPSQHRWASLNKLEGLLSARVPHIFNRRFVWVADFTYQLIARFLIPLGFTQISTGIVTASGIFKGDAVFNGLAHFIKGGIFLLYGVFSLGRWLGAFSELGWAWNTAPGGSRAPTCETVESGLIFVYGCANVFLEHLAGWGGEWSHGDLQHVSIAFMFLGGGLLGLLVESRRIRELLNAQPGAGNPLPALVIFLLGILMSSHHQHSKLSTKIHTQWGSLLAGAAVLRMATYLLFFGREKSREPARPPTEALAAFCLVAGGAVFMVSNKDTVAYLERIGVDAMFSLTVTIGLTALLCAWATVVVAVGAWARKREATGEWKVEA